MVCKRKARGYIKGMDVHDEWGAREDVINNIGASNVWETGLVTRLWEPSNTIENEQILCLPELKEESTIT